MFMKPSTRPCAAQGAGMAQARQALASGLLIANALRQLRLTATLPGNDGRDEVPNGFR
jgi:hypothetical protein